MFSYVRASIDHLDYAVNCVCPRRSDRFHQCTRATPPSSLGERFVKHVDVFTARRVSEPKKVGLESINPLVEIFRNPYSIISSFRYVAASFVK